MTMMTEPVFNRLKPIAEQRADREKRKIYLTANERSRYRQKVEERARQEREAKLAHERSRSVTEEAVRHTREIISEAKRWLKAYPKHPAFSTIHDETLPEFKAQLDKALRNLAVLDNPDVPHTRDPDT
jgi:small-conductance mechanosensitive channel